MSYYNVSQYICLSVCHTQTHSSNRWLPIIPCWRVSHISSKEDHRSVKHLWPVKEACMGRSTGGVIRAGMVAHSPMHTLPTLSHSIIRYRIILPTSLHSALCVTAPPTPLLPHPPHAGHDDAIDPSQFDVDLQTEVGQGLEVDLCHIANLHTLRCHTNLRVTHTLHFR